MNDNAEDLDKDVELDNLSTDLEAAWQAAESDEIGDDTPPDTNPGQTPIGAADGGDDPGEPAPPGDTPPGQEPPAGAPGEEPPPVAAEADQPPQGLPPEAREVWKDTPPAMRQAIARREADFAKGIQQYAENAKRAEGMDHVLQPYQQLLAMNGGASNTLPGILQTASLLQMGNPTQQAQTVANIIQQFGIDIKTLDNVLAGQAPPPEQQQNQQLASMLDERLQPVQQFMGQFQQQQQVQAQNAQHAVNDELSTFQNDPKHEFYADVRMDMADIMDMAANRGQNLTLGQAYEKACALNPQISKILEARNNQVITHNKRQAASSISGNLGGPGGVAAPDSTRAALEEAWDNVGRT